jgi:hypothetical protein
VIPGEQLGYYSPDDQLSIAKNTIDIFSGRGAWGQINNFPKIFPVAVNTRYPVQTIIDNLASTINSKIQPNLMIEDNVHGIEKTGATEAINNLMLLSDRGVVTVFPGWINKDAKFVRLREKGGFVVSAQYGAAEKEVLSVEVLSEAGQRFAIASPWTRAIVVTDEDGNSIQVNKTSAPNHANEAVYSFDTEAGKTYYIRKSDVSRIVPVDSNQQIRSYPNPVEKGKMVSITSDSKGILEEYDLSGHLLRTFSITDAQTTIQAPCIAGVYLFVLKMPDGDKNSFKDTVIE